MICESTSSPHYKALVVRNDDGILLFKHRWNPWNKRDLGFDSARHTDAQGEPEGIVSCITLDPLPPGQYRATLDVGDGALATIRFTVEY
jgi:hypothetical protein